MNSRCHGRSSCDDRALSYHLMASDVLAAMDVLKIKKAAIEPEVSHFAFL